MTDERPSFDELRDAMMPPGTDKEALWSALKGAHRTGGYVPGPQAPDISMDAIAADGLDRLRRERQRGTYIAHCTICGRDHDYRVTCADLSVPDPFTKGSEAAAGLAEMYEDLLASGIPLASVERILGAMLATYGAMTKDEP